MSFISSFEIIKFVVPELCIFSWIPASIAEAAADIPNGAKIFFASRTATFINWPAVLLNSEPKNWVILYIWALENFISVEMLFSNAFLNLVFVLL